MKKFEQEVSEMHPKNIFLIQYMRDALHTKEVKWEDITIRNLAKIREYMESIVAANTVVTYCAFIKAFLAQFSDTDLIPKDYKSALKVKKKTPSEHVTLNEEEIALIEQYEPRSQGESDVKAQFLCEYYSLARSSDINKFTAENIDEEKGIITYIAQKTKKKAIVPLHRNFLHYFNLRGKQRTRGFYNYTIQKICRNCGINAKTSRYYRGHEEILPKWAFVGSHTARRSGATNLAKRGVPIPTIAKMMSHGQDYQMTQRYIWIEEIQLDAAGEAFFGKNPAQESAPKKCKEGVRFFVSYNGKFVAERATIEAAVNVIIRKGLKDDYDNDLYIVDSEGNQYDAAGKMVICV